MVKAAVTGAADAERTLAFGYAPAGARAGLAALFALDARLGAVVRQGREPLVAQMRLTWWREALERLDAAAPPAEPVLAALAATALPAGVRGAELAGLMDAWELLLEGEALHEAELAQFAADRGGRLFMAAGAVLGAADERLGRLGEGWALADLAPRWSDAGVAATAGEMADARLRACLRRPWPRALRPLGALGLLARSDLAGGAPGSPARVGRLLAHRLTGW